MTDPSSREDAVEALARQVVAQVSPAELPLFGAVAARYRADPEGTLRPGGGRDQALGFGAETAVVLVAPFALELVRRVLGALADKLGEGAADGLAARVGAWVSGKHGANLTPAAGASAAHVQSLTPEQLRLVAETARTQAASLTLPPDQSARLADAIVATLATHG